MKRSVASSLTMLAISLLLVGCSTNKSDQKNDTSSKNAKSEKIASSKKAASESKAKESSKKKTESESKKKAESESKAKAATAAQSSTQASSSVQQQNQGPDFSLSLTDFVNRYGMSPAAYRMTKMGMSEKDALYATPDDRQSSGEIQAEYMYRNGQDPNASTTSNQDPSDYNSDYYNDDDDYEEYSDGTQKYVPGKNDDWYTEQYWKHHPEEAQKAEEDEQNADDDEDYDSYDEADY